jgi:hypothetical protein
MAIPLLPRSSPLWTAASFQWHFLILSLSLMLRPTVSRPVYLGIKHPCGAYSQIFITVRQLRVCWCGALSLTRGRVCRLQFLLTLASAVILWSESHGTRDHILLPVAPCDSQGYGGNIRPRLLITPLLTLAYFLLLRRTKPRKLSGRIYGNRV